MSPNQTTADVGDSYLTAFWNDGFKSLGDGRKYVGDVGDGRSSVMVTTFQGSITFLRK